MCWAKANNYVKITPVLNDPLRKIEDKTMIQKLNSFLRTLFIVFGAAFLLLDLLPKKIVQSDREGFDSEEFDDIW